MGAKDTMTAKLACEFTGTFLLVFTVGCNVLSGNAVWGGVSIACVLMVCIYAMGGISGGNFNPAVSVALGLSNKMPWNEVGQYIGMQLVAGIIAALCYSGLFHKPFNLAPAAGFSWAAAGVCEVLYTFMLCFVVLNVAASGVKRGPDNRSWSQNQFFGLAIGFVIIAGAYGAGAVSGGCFNPAVAVGIDVSSAKLGFGWCLAYTVFELIGAALAAGMYRVVRPEEFDPEASKEPNMTQKLVSEFLGTFMLVLTVGLNVLGKSTAGAFSIAASLMCMIYALGDVSGAKFNPAVSLAVLLSGRADGYTASDAAQEMVAQIIGGICASFTYVAIHNGESFALGIRSGFGWVELAMAEMIFTFVLCYVVLCAAVADETKTKDMFGLAIGSCVTVGGLAIGGISGGSLNPAVSFGIAAAQTVNGGFFYKAIGYSLFEMAGGVLAAVVLKLTHSAGYEEMKEAKV